MANKRVTSQVNALGVYVHVPFCTSKCRYCDFYSVPKSERAQDLMNSYTSALEKHITECAARATGYEVDTVYFGGGTPSYYGADRLRQVYQTLTKRFNVSKNAEVTLEANPESITEKGMRKLVNTGFNRISIGVQTTDNATLKVLGRRHTFRQAVHSIQIARDAGFDNVSLDLMYGLPAQTPQQWADSLGTIIDLKPDHISCYGLTLYPGTPLYYYRDQAMLPDDDAQAAMYLYAVSTLEAYGYQQYEVSNFAKANKECAHNLKYWLGGEYMSFGASASSDFYGTRYTFVSDVRQYINGVRRGDSLTTENEYVPIKERAGEYLMLRLRTRYGIEKEEYEKTFLMPFGPIEQLLAYYGSRGLARYESGYWRLTAQGFLVSNQIIGHLIDAQQRSTPLSPHRF